MEYGSHFSFDYRQESSTVPGRPIISNYKLTRSPGTCLPTRDGESVTPDEPSNCKLPVSASLGRLHPAYIARQPSPSRETTWLTRPFEPSGDGRSYQLPSQLGEGIAAARILPTNFPAFGQPWGYHQCQSLEHLSSLHNVPPNYDPLPSMAQAHTPKERSAKHSLGDALYMQEFQDGQLHSPRPNKRQKAYEHTTHVGERMAASCGLGYCKTNGDTDLGIEVADHQQRYCLASRDTTQTLTEGLGSMAARDVTGSGSSPYTLPVHGVVGEIYEQHSRRSYSSPKVEVCFGMITGMAVRIEGPLSFGARASVPVFLGGSPNMVLNTDSSLFGAIESRAAKILHVLQSEEQLSIQLYCQLPIDDGHSGRRRKGAASGGVATLSAIIYGFSTAFDDVGSFIAECDMFLQDPLHCDRNVRYRNPHRLSGPDDEVVMTLPPASDPVSARVEEIKTPRDLFLGLGDSEVLPESVVPSEIKTALRSHQKQALTFMLRREEGWVKESFHSDMWKKTENRDGHTMYTNTITNQQQSSPPPELRGGLLADQMGLGKSLSMISLIAAHPAGSLDLKNFTDCDPKQMPVKATLLVVPFSLLTTWDDQLKSHLQPHTFKWHIFHGKRRAKDRETLSQYDVVITTFQTVSVEWKKHMTYSGSSSNLLFSLHWHRVALDEAHCVTSRSTLTKKAVCDLNATHRWAITGTPVQNRLTDLAGLFQFLRLYPFSDPKVFDSQILQPWKMGNSQAVARLKALVNSVTLRRSKAVVELPVRKDEIHRLEFGPAELHFYNEIKSRTIMQLNQAVSDGGSGPSLYLNILQWINELRIICNHGVVKRKPREFMDYKSHVSSNRWDKTTAQKAFESMRDAGTALCTNCRFDLADIKNDELDAGADSAQQAHMAECLCLLCRLCWIEHEASCPPERSRCRDHPTRHFFAINPVTALHTLESSSYSSDIDRGVFPTKIEALVKDLKSIRPETKSVIFSYWTRTLDIVQSALIASSITYTRVDGKVTPGKRETALQSFREQAPVSVLLISISCGGTGLDLTAASRVYLLEPQWNPMTEEQALNRVHRMGQTKDVTTIRYIMENSIEENVLAVQAKKRDLVDLTLSSSRMTEADLGANRLEYLRSVIG